MVCALFPLKTTVLGIEVVTSRLPDVMVKLPAIPNWAFVDNLSEVPLRLALYKFAVPFSAEFPLNVVVPAEAIKLPLTSRAEEIEKLEVVVILPGALSSLKLMLPSPLIVFEAPFIVTVPEVPVKLPLTDKLPVMRKLLVVFTPPLIDRS